jgi:hypothetical protein
MRAASSQEELDDQDDADVEGCQNDKPYEEIRTSADVRLAIHMPLLRPELMWLAVRSLHAPTAKGQLILDVPTGDVGCIRYI